MVLAGGATLPRVFPCTGASSDGVHLALEYLKPSNLVREGHAGPPRRSPAQGQAESSSSVAATPGADCLGTAHRQGAASVHQFEILSRAPPDHRSDENPWPLWPLILRTSSAHEEGGERVFSVTTTEFVDNGSGAVRALRGHEVETLMENGDRCSKVVGTEFELECELVLLARASWAPSAGAWWTSSGSTWTAAVRWRRTPGGPPMSTASSSAATRPGGRA